MGDGREGGVFRFCRAAGALGDILVGVSRVNRRWWRLLDGGRLREAGIHVFVVLTGGRYRRLRLRASVVWEFGGTAGSIQR